MVIWAFGGFMRVGVQVLVACGWVLFLISTTFLKNESSASGRVEALRHAHHATASASYSLAREYDSRVNADGAGFGYEGKA